MKHINYKTYGHRTTVILLMTQQRTATQLHCHQMQHNSCYHIKRYISIVSKPNHKSSKMFQWLNMMLSQCSKQHAHHHILTMSKHDSSHCNWLITTSMNTNEIIAKSIKCVCVANCRKEINSNCKNDIQQQSLLFADSWSTHERKASHDATVQPLQKNQITKMLQ